jgi:hypothetical protein
MEITIIEIKEKNIKAIQRYLRKWRVRRNGGATVTEVAIKCKMSVATAKETLEWMFRDGKVWRTRSFDSLEVQYVG